MKFGLSTQSRGVFSTPEAYVAVALAAERAGFEFLAVNDHIIVPGTLGSAYPYTPGGVWSASEHGHCFDQLATLAFFAAATTKLRLLSSVMVVPHREPVGAAKALATIDVLSKGRLILGVGAGWMEEEFRILRAPFEDRGRATDEYIEAWKVLWTTERSTYQGKHVSFENVIFAPKPVQQPHPPIWVGGESPAAMRRVATHGDVWYPGNNNQTKPMDTPIRFAAGIADLHRVAERNGRDPKTIGIAMLAQSTYEWSAAKTMDGSARRMFTGSSAEMLADAAALADLGVGHAALRLGGASLDDSLERIARFGAEVIAKR